MIPAYRVVAGDEDITERLRRYVDELRVTSSSDRESDTLELTVSDDVDHMLGVPGETRELRVFLGYGDRLTPMGIFYRAGADVELVPRRMVVRATAADLRSRSGMKAPRTQSWDEVTLGGLVEAIATRHGYEPRVDAALAAAPIAHVSQVAESDMNLLQRLARHHDATVKAVAGRLVLLQTGTARTAGSGRPLPVVTVQAPSSGQATSIRGRVQIRGRARYGAVRASYYDPVTGAAVEVQAGEGEPVFTIRDPRPDQPQAEADAKAKLLDLHRRTGTLELTLPGDPALAAESPLEMRGWGASVDGPWIVNRASHALTGSSGYTTEVEAETAPPADPVAVRTIALGSLQPVGTVAAGSSSGGGAPAPRLPHVVERVAALHPEALRQAEHSWEFLDLVVEALRETGGPRWGYNCKRGDCSALSRDAVAYYRGAPGGGANSSDVAIVDIIAGLKGSNPRPGWLDQTAATFAAGTIGRWKYPRQ